MEAKIFEDIIKAQVAAHPSAQPTDLIKLCYQAAFGAEHLLIDRSRAEAYFYREYEATAPTQEPLIEEISEDYCRINIGAAKALGVSPETIFEAFFTTASEKSKLADSFDERLDVVGKLAAMEALPFTYDEWESSLTAYRAAGGGPVHHSDKYRQNERPAYRVAAKKYVQELKEKDND